MKSFPASSCPGKYLFINKNGERRCPHLATSAVSVRGPGAQGSSPSIPGPAAFHTMWNFAQPRRRRAGGGKYTQHSVPADSPRVPHGGRASREAGRALRAGISLEMPRVAQDSTWSQLVCRWRWPGRDQEIPGTLLQPRAALSSSHPPAPEVTALPGPRQGWLVWMLLGLGFPAKIGDKLPWFVRGLTACPRLCQAALCPSVSGWLQRGWKSFPKDPGAVPSCPLAAGGHQQLLSLARSSSTPRPRPPRVEKPPGDAAAPRTVPGNGTAREWHCPGMALPGTPLSASTQWQSLEPALAFPHHPDSEHSSLPAPSQPPLPPFWIFLLHRLDFHMPAPGLFCPQDGWL
ncbi:uncharacterized protein LOC121364849 isoform X2 [Pyrgilauda ruficollis]|uniref:uncharacterized protein LOC121364849 isoform X1 n=1 Tax=Pyrgilauda ruficollis TaxID=221976 RepID=UPI001B85F0FC|nr:uncharacterized protein LOC121364849 isoform X1 [Pyrgilauda ruficollis]XP_041344444.1 uncharacterized protein LOC121364849 isoform X2 [Pyrgilauda ruficollis]